MKPSRKLDALVAEKVMGQNPRNNGLPITVWPPHYSTDIADAWEVVEKLSGYTFSLEKYSSYWECNFGVIRETIFTEGNNEYDAYSNESPAHAICLAALKAIGIEV